MGLDLTAGTETPMPARISEKSAYCHKQYADLAQNPHKTTATLLNPSLGGALLFFVYKITHKRGGAEPNECVTAETGGLPFTDTQHIDLSVVVIYSSF